MPFSTQLTNAPNASNWSVAGPPAQCCMPGTANTRTKSLAVPPLVVLRSFHHAMVSLIEKIGSLTPCAMRSLPPRLLKRVKSVDPACMRACVDIARVGRLTADNIWSLRLKSRPCRYTEGPDPCTLTGTGGDVKAAVDGATRAVAILETDSASKSPSLH